jgi:hypothetical protein
MSKRLGALAPDGIDVVFDKVGGAVLEAALDHLAPHARVVLCGSISSGYRNAAYEHGPSNCMQLAFRRSRMGGFFFLDYVAQFPQALFQILASIQGGGIRYDGSVSLGLETARLRSPGYSEDKISESNTCNCPEITRTERVPIICILHMYVCARRERHRGPCARGGRRPERWCRD